MSQGESIAFATAYANGDPGSSWPRHAVRWPRLGVHLSGRRRR